MIPVVWRRLPVTVAGAIVVVLLCAASKRILPVINNSFTIPPNDPPGPVSAGEQPTDEMAVAFLLFTDDNEKLNR